MKIQIISDLHLESRPYTFVMAPGADVLVIAGDMAPPIAHGRLHNLLSSIRDLPVVLVAGNHDHYGDTIGGHRLTELVRKFPNARLLHDNYADMNGVRFVGGTLWSDFMLDGDPKKSGEIARRNISDFSTIAVEYELGTYRGVTPEDLIARHQRCLNAIEFHRTDRMVVVTHFLPLRESIHPQYAGSALNAYFCSDCSHTMDKVAPMLWIHGHTHSAADYMHGETRVVCNPRGYDRHENPKFDPLFCVEV